MGCEDVEGCTHFNDIYCGEDIQFEQASKSSLGGHANPNNSFMEPSKDNFASIIGEMNPAALIFATGSWGRMQDVDTTLF